MIAAAQTITCSKADHDEAMRDPEGYLTRVNDGHGDSWRCVCGAVFVLHDWFHCNRCKDTGKVVLRATAYSLEREVTCTDCSAVAEAA